MRSHKPVWLLVLLLLVSACTGQSTAPSPTTVQNPSASASPTTLSTASAPSASPTLTPAPTGTPIPEIRLKVPESQEWWQGAVFYEVFVRSFYDSDGDGTGDFNGLIDKLDYLNDGDSQTTTDLGVQALWLMPIFPSPSYHGYDISDYFTVNPEFGTLDDFRLLLDEAHAHGLRVILDLPINHTSTGIAWFQAAQDPASPYRDWYVWSETDPGVRGPDGQQVWHPAQDGGYYYGYFWEGMPDLNFNNPAVREEIKKIARFWIEEVGVDGFRLDGARYYVEEGEILSDTDGSHAWLKELRQAVKASNPQAVLVGEVWAPSLIVEEYLQGDELDLSFDFDLATATLASARTGSASSALSQLKLSTRTTPAWRYATFLTNHDQDRVINVLGQDVEKARRAAAMLLTGPGTPFIYYGEEIGMTGRGSHEAVRTPMQWCTESTACFTTGQPWAALQPDAAEHNVAAQAEDPGSLLAFYRSMISLRSRYPALQTGEPFGVTADPSSVYALLRAVPDQTLLVLVNLSPDPVEGFELSLREGPLHGEYQVSVADTILPAGESLFETGSLQANPQGGFDAYRPFPELTAGAVVVLQLDQQP